MFLQADVSKSQACDHQRQLRFLKGTQMKIQEFDEVKKAMPLTSSPPLWSSFFPTHLSFDLTASFEATIQRPSLPQPQCLLFHRYPSIDWPCRNVCSPSAFKQKIRKNKQNFKNNQQVKCGRLSKINKGGQQTTLWFCVILFNSPIHYMASHFPVRISQEDNHLSSFKDPF